MVAAPARFVVRVVVCSMWNNAHRVSSLPSIAGFVCLEISPSRVSVRALGRFLHRYLLSKTPACSQYRSRYLVYKQATELCGEKAASLQTTLIHLQWQRKHVEQRLMTKRAVQDLGTEAFTADTAFPFDETSEETTPIETGTTKNDGCSIALRSSDSQMGTSTTSISSPVAIASPGEDKRPNSRPATGEPEGLEVLQLMAKGQALSSAVMVVEGVLHKMEEQAR